MIDKAYVYILKCNDNTLYTGWTNNVEARISVHNSGNGAKYTRGRLPVTLVYLESFETRSEALSREVAIKRMSKKQKLELISNYE
jgi:putative endonuclease